MKLEEFGKEVKRTIDEIGDTLRSHINAELAKIDARLRSIEGTAPAPIEEPEQPAPASDRIKVLQAEIDALKIVRLEAELARLKGAAP